jgi:hypothetical protein
VRDAAATQLAFISLLQQCEGDVAEDVPLLAPEDATEEQSAMIRDFMVARLLLILYEHDTSVIKDAHNVKSDDEASAGASLTELVACIQSHIV